MTTNPHTITVTASPLNAAGTPLYDPSVEFTCAAGRGDPCHRYPDDGGGWYVEGDDLVDQDGDPLPAVDHDECWAKVWFTFGAYDYIGPDRDHTSSYGVPNVTRSGPVRIDFSGGGLEWSWAEDPR